MTMLRQNSAATASAIRAMTDEQLNVAVPKFTLPR